jgi:hypothetical protein
MEHDSQQPPMPEEDSHKDLARDYFIASVSCGALAGVAIGNTIALADAGIPPAAPVVEAILVCGSIACFDKARQEWQKHRQSR